MTVYQTRGNPDWHVILRGGKTPNYTVDNVKKCRELLIQAGLTDRLIIDCSHGNSLKQHRRQLDVAKDITSQLNSQDHGIVGIMAESFIEEGQQALHQQAPLVYGQSVTDACLGWKDTETLLAMLSDAMPPARQQLGSDRQTLSWNN